jgi:glycine betaine catabolism B
VTKDVQASQMMAVEVNGEKVCIANVEGRYYAIGNVCTHMDGPLAEGKIEGFEVQGHKEHILVCIGLDLHSIH